MEPNQTPQANTTTQVSSDVLFKPILFKVIYWLALIRGVFFTLSIIPFISGRIPFSPEVFMIDIFENLLFGIPLIIAFFGLRKMKIWGLYSATFMVIADLFMIFTNIDGTSRGRGSFITWGMEIVVLLYLIYRYRNPHTSNKWF